MEQKNNPSQEPIIETSEQATEATKAVEEAQTTETVEQATASVGIVAEGAEGTEGAETTDTEEAEKSAEEAEKSAEEAEKSAEATAEPQAPKKRRRKPITFWKVFGATLLALFTYTIIKLLVLGGVIAALLAEEEIVIPERAVLKIDLAETISDARLQSSLAFDAKTLSFRPQLALIDALASIEVAATDKRIKGIYINMTGGAEISPVILEELRNAIEKFKLSGKFVVAYHEQYTPWNYYVSSVADQIYMHPEGIFNWTGMNATTVFFTGLIEKLGIGIDVLRPEQCRFKSAVEPFILHKLSPENRQQMQMMTDDMWAVITQSISTSRNISVEELNLLATNLSVVLPEEALEHKMIDGLMYADQMRDYFVKKVGAADKAMVSLSTYAKSLQTNPEKKAAPKVAVVYAQGNVVDGEGGDDAIYGYTLSRTLKKVRQDDSIKAVLLRVNSPGGSALAADIIWREMQLLQKTKPVVVSMGDYAASGGYYISAPADAIFANQMTITGSIGVFGIIPNFGTALKDNLGISFETVKTNNHNDISQMIEPLTSDEKAAMMRTVNGIYERFTSLVAEGRNLPIESVYEIAEGKIWTGHRAQQIGLVDACGGFSDALAYVVNLAGLGSNFQIVEMVEEPKGFAAILNALSTQTSQQLLKEINMEQVWNELLRVQNIITKKGVYMFCPYLLDFSK